MSRTYKVGDWVRNRLNGTMYEVVKVDGDVLDVVDALGKHAMYVTREVVYDEQESMRQTVKKAFVARSVPQNPKFVINQRVRVTTGGSYVAHEVRASSYSEKHQVNTYLVARLGEGHIQNFWVTEDGLEPYPEQPKVIAIVPKIIRDEEGEARFVDIPNPIRLIAASIGEEITDPDLLAFQSDMDFPMPVEWAPEGKYLPIARAFAKLGKGKRTNVGAVILDQSSSMRAQGWHGAPRGCNGDTDQRVNSRAEKLLWRVHAEQNAIANAARAGIALDGCTMVITHPPCMVCANLIVQVGIKRVLCPQPDERFLENWGGDVARARLLFAETNVEFNFIKE